MVPRRLRSAWLLLFLLSVGRGDVHVLFAAHMDEVGFRVEEILADGRRGLEIRGGLLAVEVADRRDIESLTRLIIAAATNQPCRS